MKKDKLSYRVARGIMIILFVIFLALYFSESSGYYEFKNFKTKELTDKQIKQFENDISKGKDVSIEDYVVVKNKDYSNKLSKAGSSLSNGISHLVEKGLNNTFSLINKFIEE